MNTLRRIKSVLGLRDGLLVVGFLAANTLVDVVLEVIPPGWSHLLWAALLMVTTGFLAWRVSTRSITGSDLDGDGVTDAFGVRGDALLALRQGVVALVGLDSDGDNSALAQLLARTPNLKFLALIGTYETTALGVTDRIISRLLPASGHSLSEANIRVWTHNQALSVADHVESTHEAISWLVRHDVSLPAMVVDVTAGRRMAGFGALRSADAHRVESQYLAYRWDHHQHKPLVGSPSFRVISAFHHGQAPEVVRDGMDTTVALVDADPASHQNSVVPKFSESR